MFLVLNFPCCGNTLALPCTICIHIHGGAAAVKMMVRAFREDPAEAREKEKDLILDDHTQCGCSCGEGSGGHTLTCLEHYDTSFPYLP